MKTSSQALFSARIWWKIHDVTKRDTHIPRPLRDFRILCAAVKVSSIPLYWLQHAASTHFFLSLSYLLSSSALNPALPGITLLSSVQIAINFDTSPLLTFSLIVELCHSPFGGTRNQTTSPVCRSNSDRPKIDRSWF